MSAAIIATIVISGSRHDRLPRWLVYAGWLGVVGSIAGVIFIPFVLPLLWYLAVAIVGFARAAPGTPPQPTAGT